jgi:hypothetical protein
MKRNQKRTTKTAKRNRKSRRAEQPTDLWLWPRNGACLLYRARVGADTEVSIGRTNSKRALGFEVKRGKTCIDFVLDKDQVTELAAYLRMMQPRLLKPLGRKQDDQASLAAAALPKRRLFNLLENAAIEAHPGWHRSDEATIEQDEGAPGGRALVAWFKKAHPKTAARFLPTKMLARVGNVSV